MSKSLAFGPNSSAVAGVSSLTFAPAPINFAADMRKSDSGPGKVVYTDVTSPIDQPSTLRISQVAKANVYAGTSISPEAMLSNKRGIDTVLEIKETWKVTDSADTTFSRYAPARCAITLNLPLDEVVTAAAVKHLVDRAVAALFAQGDATITNGANALLHGVVEKG